MKKKFKPFPQNRILVPLRDLTSTSILFYGSHPALFPSQPVLLPLTFAENAEEEYCYVQTFFSWTVDDFLNTMCLCYTVHCAGPENIHTPPTEGIGIS